MSNVQLFGQARGTEHSKTSHFPGTLHVNDDDYLFIAFIT
jgi:hypothetical protein